MPSPARFATVTTRSPLSRADSYTRRLSKALRISGQVEAAVLEGTLAGSRKLDSLDWRVYFC